MKRIAVILFASLYLVSITGLAISNFYCCGKFKEAYIFNCKSTPKNCKGDKLPGCCDTKTVLVKVKDSHSASSQLKVSGKELSVSNFTATVISVRYFYSEESSLLALIHAPPLISEQPVYLSVHNFRI